MQYLLLIYSNEEENAAMSDGARKEMFGGYYAFNEHAKKNGNFVAGDALHSTSSAKTVRVRDGETTTTDGPFAETKEQLGGYYLVEAKDESEAIALAAKIPTAKQGCVEVRAIMNYELDG
ncbi:MAG: YciI family protein [Polyangiales bacterium]